MTGPVLKEKQAGLEVVQVLKDLYEAAGARATSAAGEKKGAEAAPAAAGGAAGALAAELGAMRDPKSWVFNLHPVGVRGAIFVKMKIPEKDAAWAPRPSELVHEMMKQTQETGVSHCRFASRVLPIDHTCFCKLEDMRTLAARVIPAAFADGERVTFSVQYEHRAAEKLDRGEVIDAFAKAVPERHGVDLGSPQRTILVQLVKSTCAVAVVEGFKRLSKYNLKTLTGLDECGRPLKPKPSAGGQPGGEGEEAVEMEKKVGGAEGSEAAEAEAGTQAGGREGEAPRESPQQEEAGEPAAVVEGEERAEGGASEE